MDALLSSPLCVGGCFVALLVGLDPLLSLDLIIRWMLCHPAMMMMYLFLGPVVCRVVR